ncbi:hypothetical protein HEP73_03074 [Xanthomonas sp. GW]|nr:hypothetical protein HEP73_03074 [Xanthomonas sp. GW]
MLSTARTAVLPTTVPTTLPSSVCRRLTSAPPKSPQMRSPSCTSVTLKPPQSSCGFVLSHHFTDHAPLKSAFAACALGLDVQAAKPAHEASRKLASVPPVDLRIAMWFSHPLSYDWQSSQRWILLLLFQARNFPTVTSENVSIGDVSRKKCTVPGFWETPIFEKFGHEQDEVFAGPSAGIASGVWPGRERVGHCACEVEGSEQVESDTPCLRFHCHVATVSPRGLYETVNGLSSRNSCRVRMPSCSPCS